MKFLVTSINGIVFLIIGLHPIFSQNPILIKRDNWVTKYQMSANSNATIQSDSDFTAIVIRSAREAIFSVLINGDTLVIPRDHDAEDPTYFLSLPVSSKQLIVHESSLDFELFMINSGAVPAANTNIRQQLLPDVCDDPLSFIPQSDWRSGLPEPDYSRSFHTVFHTIIHHSAGSNSNTNYTQVVRDIYLYHTEINGWSDIGYNYLISQDGTLYAGRDPGAGSQDLVRGAHFCGANTGTLGVCLLGNYEEVVPSDASIGTLEYFLIHQMIKQDLDPQDYYPHTAGTIGTIAGHRDGCATLCPGENVYSMLEELKLKVEREMIICEGDDFDATLSFEASSYDIETGEVITLTSTSTGYDTIWWQLEGATPSSFIGVTTDVTYDNPGWYDIRLIGSNVLGQDTLLHENAIRVIGNSATLYPNPITSNQTLFIDFDLVITSINLFNMNGKIVELNRTGINEYTLGTIQPGMYFVKIETLDEVRYEKLIINE